MIQQKPFETMDEIRDYVSGNRIQCLVCGGYYRRLQYAHLAMHGMTADEYRAAFGIPWKTSLTSARSRAASSRAVTPERIEAFRRMAIELGVRERNRKGKMPRLSAPAVRKQWRQSAKLGRYLASERTTVLCVDCGTPVETTRLCATQPIHCEACASPAALRQRRRRRKALDLAA